MEGESSSHEEIGELEDQGTNETYQHDPEEDLSATGLDSAEGTSGGDMMGIHGLLLQAQQNASVDQENDANVMGEHPAGVDSTQDQLQLESMANQSVHTVTLEDGSTAYIQHNKGDEKVAEGQTIQLADGSTAVVQKVAETAEVDPEPEAEPDGTKFIDGQAVQLEDGTTVYIHSTPKAGLQAVQLEDGTTAYISQTPPDQLLPEPTQVNNTVDQNTVTLEITPDGQFKTQDTNGTVKKFVSKEEADLALARQQYSERAIVMTEKVFKCDFPQCGKMYTTSHHLKVHERNHTGQKPFKCQCGKTFATGYGLKSHTRIHTGEKPYKCPDEHCNKCFKTSGDMQKHVRTHTGERPFKCPFEGCHRAFTTSNIRKVHIRTHTGERPYICEEEGCGRAFASATNYKNHVRIHTGEKPYVCTVQGCGKRFTEYSSLYKHHVVHTHTKPYICNHCGKNYRQTSTLAMHKRTAHNDDTGVEEATGVQIYPPTNHQITIGGLNDGSQGPAAKKQKLDFQGSSEGGTGPGEEGDGNLVINTSESGAQQIQMVGNNPVLSGAGGSQTMVIQANSTQLQPLMQQMVNLGGDQQIFVVTDPAQIQALQSMSVPVSVSTQIASESSATDSHNKHPAVIATAAESMSTGTISVADNEQTIVYTD
ncbi:unnamed protein product [Owenia fusiformis]|uniref:Uncharacterized protein n=1 Tax=Owenia fusiformis TaxID=6347 RepID=A0A8J1TYT9_OWEFU|nr:unnamed protein product [Owenia fusiformis]